MTSRRLAAKPSIRKVAAGRAVPGWRVTVQYVDHDPQILTWQSRDEAFAYAHGLVRKYCKPGHVDPEGRDWEPLVRPQIVAEALAPPTRDGGWPA